MESNKINLICVCIDHLLDLCCIICRFMKDKVLPGDNICPSTHKEATKSIEPTKQYVHLIHACENDCMLLWEQDNINLTSCTICGKDRYRSDTSGKKIPYKVSYYKPFQ